MKLKRDFKDSKKNRKGLMYAKFSQDGMKVFVVYAVSTN
jgi:hypothetical protein